LENWHFGPFFASNSDPIECNLTALGVFQLEDPKIPTRMGHVVFKGASSPEGLVCDGLVIPGAELLGPVSFRNCSVRRAEFGPVTLVPSGSLLAGLPHFIDLRQSVVRYARFLDPEHVSVGAGRADTRIALRSRIVFDENNVADQAKRHPGSADAADAS